MNQLPSRPTWCKYIRKMFGPILHIYDPLLKENFFVYTGKSPAPLMARFKKLGIEYDRPDTCGNFSVIESRGISCGVIYAENKMTLMHECLHAAMWALSEHGIKVDSEHDEILAYYQEFLFRWATLK